MIADAINSAFADVWAKVAYYVTFSFLDPFWGWVSIGAMIIATVVVICWFFGSWFPVLRPIGGVIVMLVLAALASFREGEKEARDHDKPKRPAKRP